MSVSSIRYYRERIVSGPAFAAAIRSIAKGIARQPNEFCYYLSHSIGSSLRNERPDASIEALDETPELVEAYVAVELPKRNQDGFEIIFSSRVLKPQINMTAPDASALDHCMRFLSRRFPCRKRPVAGRLDP